MILCSAYATVVALLLLQGWLTPACAFLPTVPTTTSTLLQAASQEESLTGSNQWMQDYRIASGEVINPYEVLKVSRTATATEVRQSYISLSRRYHPVRFVR